MRAALMLGALGRPLCRGIWSHRAGDVLGRRTGGWEGAGDGTGGLRCGRGTWPVQHVLGEVGAGGGRAGEYGTEGVEEFGVGRRRRDGHFSVLVFVLLRVAVVVPAVEAGCLVGAFSHLRREVHVFGGLQWMKHWLCWSHFARLIGLFPLYGGLVERRMG